METLEDRVTGGGDCSEGYEENWRRGGVDERWKCLSFSLSQHV